MPQSFLPPAQENYANDTDAALRDILRCSLREKAGDESAIVEAFDRAILTILSTEQLFQRVPVRLHTFGDCQPTLGYPGHRDVDLDFRLGNMFLPDNGVLLIDKLHSKAGGAFGSIYRARGQRLYLLQNGVLAPFFPYAEISKDGFHMRSELPLGIWNAFDIDSEELRTFIFNILDDPNTSTRRFICRDIIAMLCGIKEPFHRDYPLEYLVLPPDVDLLSNFSTDIKRRLWNICLNGEFVNEIGLERQEQCMSMLLEAGCSPTPGQLVAYLSNPGGEGTTEVLRRLTQLERAIEGYREDVSGVAEAFARQTASESQLQRPLDAPALFSTVLTIVSRFKELVENNGLWKELWHGSDVRGEKSLQRLFYAFAHSFCKAHNLDLAPEADAGNGPVDFKLSTGARAKVLVELKLSTNQQVAHGYHTQLEVYKHADETPYAIFVLVDVGDLGAKLKELQNLRDEALQQNSIASEIVYIDGRQKLSASKRRGP